MRKLDWGKYLGVSFPNELVSSCGVYQDSDQLIVFSSDAERSLASSAEDADKEDVRRITTYDSGDDDITQAQTVVKEPIDSGSLQSGFSSMSLDPFSESEYSLRSFASGTSEPESVSFLSGDQEATFGSSGHHATNEASPPPQDLQSLSLHNYRSAGQHLHHRPGEDPSGNEALQFGQDLIPEPSGEMDDAFSVRSWPQGQRPDVRNLQNPTSSRVGNDVHTREPDANMHGVTAQ